MPFCWVTQDTLEEQAYQGATARVRRECATALLKHARWGLITADQRKKLHTWRWRVEAFLGKKFRSCVGMVPLDPSLSDVSDHRVTAQMKVCTSHHRVGAHSFSPDPSKAEPVRVGRPWRSGNSRGTKGYWH